MTIQLRPTITTFNRDKLHEEFDVAFGAGVARQGYDGAHYVIVTNEAITLQQVQTVIDTHNPATLTENQQTQVAKAGLKSKISLAQTHADAIKNLFNEVLDQTLNQTVQPDRFNVLKAIIDASVPAFRNRLITDIQQELGIDVTGSLTLAQQRQCTLYIRAWVTGLALLLSLA